MKIKQIKIPKKFWVAGIPFTVNITQDLAKHRNRLGEIDYARQEILIDKDASNRETREVTFCHEKVHAILYVMGEDELRDNEKFVDSFAHLLHQALTMQED